MNVSTSSACPAVLLIIFNRPDQTRRVMEAIRKAHPSRLYIAADGPRERPVGEVEACESARTVAMKIDWPCEMFTLFRETNLACKLGPSTAMDWFFEHESEGIISKTTPCRTHPFSASVRPCWSIIGMMSG
jgi:hypothetical protein